MNQAMEKLERMQESEYSTFTRVLFGMSSPWPIPHDVTTASGVGKVDWIDPSLNDSQKSAILFALASRDVALIHGPPGVQLCPPTRTQEQKADLG